MPVVITTVLPPEATIEVVLEIESRLPTSYPDSFIAHAVTFDEGRQRVRLTDIWTSAQAQEEFFRENVLPVLEKAAAEAGRQPPRSESQEVAETVVFFTGPGAAGGR